MTLSPARSAPRVLVVEGRGSLREALQESLSSTFSVSTCRSSEGALGGFSNYRPRAVVICETQSGEMGGLELVEALRTRELGKNCLFIVYGGVRVDAAAAKSQFGVDEYLTSKVTLGQIDELLCKHLRMGWSPVRDSGATEDDSGRFRHPMAGKEMLSARVQQDEPVETGKKKGFFSRIFGS